MNATQILYLFFVITILFLFSAGCLSKTDDPVILQDTVGEKITGSNPSFPSTSIGNGLSHISRSTGLFTINATVAGASRTTLPVYRGVLREGDSINKRFQSSRPRQNVTTPEEAPEVARKVLESYGGLPTDAVSEGASTQYSRVYIYTLEQYVSKKPISTTISYSQKKINGLWTIGEGNYISVELGENGELLRIVKLWRNYTYVGDVPIISLDTAIDKLERQELIESEWHPETGDITIDLISPGYYAKEISKNETILEPLWMFYGSNTSTGARLGFYVYAREFANFSATSRTATSSETISFTDTSDASPTQWYWDFGDGMNSTLRNPVHAYLKAGKYTVNLTAWNDLGSDTVIKPVQVIP